MSLLAPVTVHIKRKATDEPVDFLRVHESNGKRRRRATEFIFTRQTHRGADDDHSNPQAAPQGVRRIKQIHRSASSHSLTAQSDLSQLQLQSSHIKPGGQQHGTLTQSLNEPLNEALSRALQTPHTTEGVSRGAPPHLPTNPVLSSQSSPSKRKEQTPPQVVQARVFRISRSSNTRGFKNSAIGGSRRSSTRRTHPTIFVERRTPARQREFVSAQHTLSIPELGKSHVQIRPQKKPGLAARLSSKAKVDKPSSVRSSTAQSVPPRLNISLPSGLLMPWDVDSSDLVAQMQAFTLEEIGRNIAKSDTADIADETTTTGIPARLKSRRPSKFKPKKPALRYFERHPEKCVTLNQGIEMVVDKPADKPVDKPLDKPLEKALEMALDQPVDEDVQNDEDMDDGSEYVIDTYVRVPADAIPELDTKTNMNIGLLVLDSQSEIDEFYMYPSGSSDEDEDDSEDENAEGYYRNDYPAEEISDYDSDEYPYKYQNRNSSDLEEFDLQIPSFVARRH